MTTTSVFFMLLVWLTAEPYTKTETFNENLCSAAFKTSMFMCTDEHLMLVTGEQLCLVRTDECECANRGLRARIECISGLK